MKEDWHFLNVKEVLNRLETSKKGLSREEAENRLKKFGLNKLPDKESFTRFKIFFNQFKSPLVYILLAAALISFFLKEFVDMSVILAAVALNTILGFLQENKANQALAQLKKMVEYEARVRREEKEVKIKAEEIVPGDILFLEAGDKVPADLRLLEVNNLEINEAALTGESFPVNKALDELERGTVLADRKNMTYMGTVVTRGRAVAVVVSTGSRTYLGEIADLVKKAEEEKTPLQIKLSSFSRFLALVVSLICLVILFIGIFTERSFFEMLLIAVAVAVAAIPEGLLISVTVVLALGMQRILKKKALVRNLLAAETLGSTSVICMDKTGTLTEGKMRVIKILTGEEEFSFHGSWTKMAQEHFLALKIGLLNNNAVIENPEDDLNVWRIIGEGTEEALLSAAIQAGLNKEGLEKEEPRLHEIPFDEEKKFMATLHKTKKGNIIYFKGSPEVILSFSGQVREKGTSRKLDKERMKILKKEYESLSAKGLRVLALAYKKTKEERIAENDLRDITFLGFAGIKDPLRSEAKETIDLCRKAGIRPIIVTGDHKLTAKAIYEELGLFTYEENILEGKELDKMSDQELEKRIKKIDIYARVEPKHKLRIIDAWQSRGEVVAMSGDGVNDSPALKSADIGIALGSGADAAKETSDIVLLDNNFKVIIDAVEQGRNIFENIKKVILFLLSGGFTEIIIILGSLLLALPLPVTAAQILWVNLVEDGLPNIALAFEKGNKEVMKDRPRKKNVPLLNTEMKILIFLIGIITDIVLFTLFFALYKLSFEITHIRTIIFAALGTDSLLYVFSCRNLRHALWKENPFSNKFLVFSVIIGFVAILSAVYFPFFQKILQTVPLGGQEWLLIFFLGFFKLFLIELTKYIFVIKKMIKKTI